MFVYPYKLRSEPSLFTYVCLFSIDEELRRLHRRTQSVMKKVELYESMKRQAEESRVNTSYTMWRKRQSTCNSSKTNELIDKS